MENEIKIAIIEENGNIYRQNVGTVDYFHSYLLSEYAVNNYTPEELGETDLKNANSIAITLRELGNIVFLNTTTYIEKTPSKHGRTGIVIMPDTITEEQQDALIQLEEELGNYNEIQLWYAFSNRNNCKMLRANGKEEVNEIIITAITESNSHKTR